MGISASQYASKRVKFLGTDARLTIIFLLTLFLFKTWITLILFIAIFIFSLILEYNNIEFLNFLKKIRMFITGSRKKRIRKTY